MLLAATFRRRVTQLAWTRASVARSYARDGRARRGQGDERRGTSNGKSERGKHGKGEEKTGSSSGKSGGEWNGKSDDRRPPPPPPEVSLMEQLFPERYTSGGAGRGSARQVPPIATPHVETRPPLAPGEGPGEAEGLRGNQKRLHKQFAEQSAETSVLVLHNAGKNLTEEDFRRVIPQGTHLDGWTLERGDILRVIPQRDMHTLEPLGTYYILFSSPLSAFTYRGHIHRVHKMVVENSPSSILSPIPPPPGQKIDGMDAYEAMNSFTLVPPDQNLSLRQLKRPFSPAMNLLVKHGGYELVMQRKDRMPFEARLALEGPQLQLPVLRYILRASGKDRGLSWSGNEEHPAVLSKWEPPTDADRWDAMSNRSDTAITRSEKLADEQERDVYKRHFRGQDDGDTFGPEEIKRRTPNPIYIAGFESEHARQSFIHFWHGRAMAWEGAARIGGYDEGDVPPVVNVDPLW